MVGSLVTHLVSHSPELIEYVKNALTDRSKLICHESVDTVSEYIERHDASGAPIILEVDNESDQLTHELRKLKRIKNAKYTPIIGISHIPAQEIKFSCAQHLFHVLNFDNATDTLKNTIHSAQTTYVRYLDLIQDVKSRTSAIGLIESGTFKLQTLKQAEALTTMLSLAYPNPAVVALGISELLINAIEHGNLDISYNEKSELLENGQWETEIKHRLSQKEHSNKFVHIDFKKYDDRIEIIIEDEGKGFNWRSYLEASNCNVNDLHGRGILVAKEMGFDRLKYNAAGNCVTATIHLTK